MKKQLLWVMATEKHSVPFVDSPPRSGGSPNFVGKEWVSKELGYQVDPNGVKVAYHPHYISCLKDGSLLAVDMQTAHLAGIAWTDPTHVSVPVIERGLDASFILDLHRTFNKDK